MFALACLQLPTPPTTQSNALPPAHPSIQGNTVIKKLPQKPGAFKLLAELAMKY